MSGPRPKTDRPTTRPRAVRELPSGGFLATVDETSGKAGSPTPSERRAYYLATLRKGPLPPGWGQKHATLWGVHPSLISDELREARATLEAARTPTAAQIAAHEQTWQAVELADEALALAREPDDDDEDDEPARIVARIKAREARIKALTSIAALKLRAAASYLAIHKPPPGGQPQQPAPPPDIGASLKG